MINIDGSYTLLDHALRGRKPKFKLEKEGKKYIFKYGAINNEIWAELIAQQLGLQAGINMAHYELACCQGTYGVLTTYFLKPLELIISSDNLKQNMQKVCDENNIKIDFAENTISNVVTAASLYDNRTDTKALELELMLRWAFYGMIIESDKNDTNIAFIQGNSGFTLTPDYDNSSMACLNKNINTLLDSLKQGNTVYTITDNIKTNLKISEDDTGFFLQDFDNFSKKYPEECDYCMERLSHIDVDTAFEIVEEMNETEIPWEVKYWVSKTVKARYEDMKNIHNRNKIQRGASQETNISQKKN